jgi:hypothetical protein
MTWTSDYEWKDKKMALSLTFEAKNACYDTQKGFVLKLKWLT